MAKNKDKTDIDAIFKDGKLIDEAMNRALKEAVRRHKFFNVPMVVWKDGKVEWISPDQLEVDSDSVKPPDKDS